MSICKAGREEPPKVKCLWLVTCSVSTLTCLGAGDAPTAGFFAALLTAMTTLDDQLCIFICILHQISKSKCSSHWFELLKFLNSKICADQWKVQYFRVLNGLELYCWDLCSLFGGQVHPDYPEQLHWMTPCQQVHWGYLQSWVLFYLLLFLPCMLLSSLLHYTFKHHHVMYISD